ncbi:MAG: gamma-glutamyl-gamma-aminobutyrate hydrolase family protein [Pseudomonadota bacterium]
MLLGILEVGRVHEDLIAAHGDYPTQFAQMFQSVDPSIEIEVVGVLDGALPTDPHAVDAWVVIGSKHGVYDPLPWIDPLKAFFRQAREAGVPLIGVCFGHQLMAEAFGGKAEKFGGGWACGVHHYALHETPSWIDGSEKQMSMHAMHQDQVTLLPSDATCLASSDFCRYAMVSYGDPELPDAISIQPHPEFHVGYARDLLDMRSGVAVPVEIASPALESLGQDVDNQAFASWAVAYLRRALSSRQAA